MTKKVRNLMDKLVLRETLEQAADDALDALNDKDIWYARKFKRHRKESLDKIQNMLILGIYPKKVYKSVEIQTDNKTRVITPEHFDPWNIVSHALKIVLEPISERVLIDNSSAGRKGKGQVYGALRVQKFIKKNKNFTHYGSGDIRKFYPSMPHSVVIYVLKRYIDDDLFIDCVKHVILDYESDIEPVLIEEHERKLKFCNWASNMPLGHIGEKRGITLGNSVGQMIGNLALSIVDRKMTQIEHTKGYHRHCDDITFFAESKERAIYLLTKLDIYCNELGVCLKASSFIAPLPDERKGIVGRELDFIGWKYTRDTMLVRKRTKNKSFRAFTRVKSRRRRQELIGAYYGIYKWGNCKRLWKTIIYKDKIKKGDEL